MRISLKSKIVLASFLPIIFGGIFATYLVFHNSKKLLNESEGIIVKSFECSQSSKEQGITIEGLEYHEIANSHLEKCSEEELELQRVHMRNLLGRSMLSISLSVLVVAIVIGLFVIYFVDILFKPLESLRIISEKIKNGDFSTKVKINSNDEIEEIGRNLTLAMINLEEKNAKIELDIKDSFEKLSKINAFMVGREFKMIELKKEIADLKKEIEQKNAERKK